MQQNISKTTITAVCMSGILVCISGNKARQIQTELESLKQFQLILRLQIPK